MHGLFYLDRLLLDPSDWLLHFLYFLVLWFTLSRLGRGLYLGLLSSRSVGIAAFRLSHPSLVAHHPDLADRVLVDAESKLLILIVVQGVEVPEEQLSEDEVLVVELVQLVLGDCKLALALSLIQILARAHLKDCIACFVGSRDQESDWFKSLL